MYVSHRLRPLPSATSSLCGLYSLTALLLAELVFRVASRTAFYKRALSDVPADPAWKWCADTHAHPVPLVAHTALPTKAQTVIASVLACVHASSNTQVRQQNEGKEGTGATEGTERHRTTSTIQQHRTSNIEHRTSNIEHRTSKRRKEGRKEHRTSNIEHRTSNIEHRTSNTEHRTSNVEHRTSNIKGTKERKERKERQRRNERPKSKQPARSLSLTHSLTHSLSLWLKDLPGIHSLTHSLTHCQSAHCHSSLTLLTDVDAH